MITSIVYGLRAIFGLKSALGMSLRKVTLLGSNLASVTDLKRIETPNSLCCSEAIKPLQLVGQEAQFKFESKFEPLQVI